MRGMYAAHTAAASPLAASITSLTSRATLVMRHHCTCITCYVLRTLADAAAYRMSSNSPSGGMKVTTLLASYVPRLTHCTPCAGSGVSPNSSAVQAARCQVGGLHACLAYQQTTLTTAVLLPTL